MIKYLTIKILKYFDLYYQLKLFKFLKSQNYNTFYIFFDIGAHMGESIILFSKNFKINKIYSFEASPLNFAKLQKNKSKIQSNFKDLEINLENYAIGNDQNKVVMKQLNESSSSTIKGINQQSKYFKKKFFFLNFIKKKKFFHNLEVNQIKLSDYMEKKKILKVDFLKIDTEGYEFNVLLGLGKYLQKVSLIMFEHHYDDMIKKDYSFGDIHDLLKKNNFEQIYKYKMPFRKTFEYIYKKK
jgi:methyltransferase, FkbM family